MSKIIRILKQTIYWLSVVMPVIDGVKTVIQCVTDGIEQGKADIQQLKDGKEAEKFLDINNNQTIDPDVSLDDIFKGMK